MLPTGPLFLFPLPILLLGQGLSLSGSGHTSPFLFSLFTAPNVTMPTLCFSPPTPVELNVLPCIILSTNEQQQG